jgi:hypothetical protein
VHRKSNTAYGVVSNSDNLMKYRCTKGGTIENLWLGTAAFDGSSEMMDNVASLKILGATVHVLQMFLDTLPYLQLRNIINPPNDQLENAISNFFPKFLSR